MTSIPDTAAALNAATVKLHAAVDRIADLQEQEAQLSNALGEAVANDDAELASELKDKRALIRDALEDLLYARNTLGKRAEDAEKAHKDAAHAAHVQAMKAQVSKVRAAGEKYETALGLLVTSRAQFVNAGAVLSRLAASGGDQFASRFATAQLADDVLQRRCYGRQNPEFDRPVTTLLQHLEGI